jgi:hypothetical protein
MPSDCGNRDAQSRRRWDDVASPSSRASITWLPRISDATSRGACQPANPVASASTPEREWRGLRLTADR